jgi:transposase
VFAGNTGDPETLLEQVEKLQQDFAMESVILVGDRGRISQKQVTALRDREGVDWITTLNSGAIRALVDDGTHHPGHCRRRL